MPWFIAFKSRSSQFQSKAVILRGYAQVGKVYLKEGPGVE